MATKSEVLRGEITSSGVKKVVLKRDCFKCSLCLDKKELRVHHVIPVHIDEELSKLESNMITLCKHCHTLAHNGNNHNINKTLQTILQAIILHPF